MLLVFGPGGICENAPLEDGPGTLPNEPEAEGEPNCWTAPKPPDADGFGVGFGVGAQLPEGLGLGTIGGCAVGKRLEGVLFAGLEGVLGIGLYPLIFSRFWRLACRTYENESSTQVLNLDIE